jgi:hypothetical protein
MCFAHLDSGERSVALVMGLSYGSETSEWVKKSLRVY